LNKLKVETHRGRAGIACVWPLLALAAATLACASLGAPAATPPPAQPTLPAPVIWRVPAGNSVITPPALADGLLVYLTSESQVIAVDAATGAQKWSQSLNVSNDAHRPLAVTNGVVFADDTVLDNIGTDRHEVVALDLHTGAILWQTPQSPAANAFFLYPPVAANAVVYYESETGPGGRQLTAADARTGNVYWQSPFTGTALAGDPAIDGALLYVPIDHAAAADSNSFTTDLVGLDATTGARRWLVEMGSLAAHILAAGGGKVFATTADGTCWAIDGSTGQVAWKFKFDDSQPAPPLLAGDTLYFGDSQGRLYALDAATGAKRWVATVGRNLWRRPAVAGGRVYIGTSDGYLAALEAASGSVVWKTQNPQVVPFANSPYIPPVDTEPVAAGGTLYFFRPDDLMALRIP